MDRMHEKEVRRYRRNERQRKVREARELMKRWRGSRPVEPSIVVPGRDIEECAVRMANNMKKCSCCKSERKMGKGDGRLTLQERKFKDVETEVA